jgi:hypothetical protein
MSYPESLPIPSCSSPLATYYRDARHQQSRNGTKIDVITIHCYGHQVTAKEGCAYFANLGRTASCNYVIGYDCNIGVCVPESRCSFCSSKTSNDMRAVTIEVSCHGGHPYRVDDAVYETLLDLITDVCLRNGIQRLVWSENKEDRINYRNGCNMTVHRDYYPKACPGDYLYSLHGQIAETVNQRLCAIYVSNFHVPEVFATKVFAEFNVTEHFGQYKWSYRIHTLDSTKNYKGAIKVKDKSASLLIQNLTPNTPYYLEILAKPASGNNQKDFAVARQLVYTRADKPSSIQDLKFDISGTYLQNKVCSISFKAPDSWGESTSDIASSGFRVSLILNGKIIAHSDNLFIHSTGVVSKKINLADIVDIKKLAYKDTIQIGIQTWIKNNSGELTFDNYTPVCSEPIYLEPLLTDIDKIYINVNNKFKRSILYNLIKQK